MSNSRCDRERQSVSRTHEDIQRRMHGQQLHHYQYINVSTRFWALGPSASVRKHVGSHALGMGETGCMIIGHSLWN